jgi:hypothetical protein
MHSKDHEKGITCQFGRFGTSPGTYINSTCVKCVTPDIKDDVNSF